MGGGNVIVEGSCSWQDRAEECHQCHVLCLSCFGSTGHLFRAEIESCECSPRNEVGYAVGECVPLLVWIQDWVSHPCVTSTDDKVTQRS